MKCLIEVCARLHALQDKKNLKKKCIRNSNVIKVKTKF